MISVQNRVVRSMAATVNTTWPSFFTLIGVVSGDSAIGRSSSVEAIVAVILGPGRGLRQQLSDRGYTAALAARSAAVGPSAWCQGGTRASDCRPPSTFDQRDREKGWERRCGGGSGRRPPGAREPDGPRQSWRGHDPDVRAPSEDGPGGAEHTGEGGEGRRGAPDVRRRA